jgi:hypothetical protein
VVDLQGLHQLVHLLLNVVSVLNTILLAIDALFPSARVTPPGNGAEVVKK